MLIGTSVMVLPFQHILRTAEDAAPADAVSSLPVPNFDVRNVPQRASMILFPESVEIIKKAFTQNNFSHEGNFWKVRNATISPKPVQKLPPPIY